MTTLRSVRAAAAAFCLLIPTAPAHSPDFAAFVDRYLDGFARRHPSIAGDIADAPG